MAGIAGKTGKRLIHVDVNFDTICPWSFVGKRSLDKAMLTSNALFDFEVQWHPFLTFPTCGKGGMSKERYYKMRFESEGNFISRISAVFKKELGMEFSLDGQSGNSLDSHRLVYFAGLQNFHKQHTLVENLFVGHFVNGESIVNRKFLVSAAKDAGVEGAAEFLKNPDNGVNEVLEDFVEHTGESAAIPLYMVRSVQRGRFLKLSGIQPPEVFVRYFKAVAIPKNER